MTTFTSWTRRGSDRPAKVHRCYEVLGADAVIRTDCVAEILDRVAPSVVLRISASDLSPERLWSEVCATPFGSGTRAIIVSDVDQLKWWDPLRTWLSDRARHAGSTLVLFSGASDRGRRRRNRQTGKWETELAEWQLWVDNSCAATTIECPVPSVDTVGSARAPVPSQVAVWLSQRLPVSQRQAEHLWRRAGGSTSLARDTLDQLRLLGVSDARDLGERTFASYIDDLVLPQGAESFTEDLLFDRRAVLCQTLQERELSRADWSKIIGLLTQRLEWLEPLYHALRSKESLSTVTNRLKIHEKWVLHYAHREDKSHNIALRYSPRRVAACRHLLADLDAALASSLGVPVGLGEVLVSEW